MSVTIINPFVFVAASSFPQVAATNTSTAASSTSIVISLPSGIANGDLLIAMCFGYADRTHTWPAGWTELWDSDTGNIAAAGAYRVADGGEGSTITVTLGIGATSSSHITYRITGYQGTPEVGTAVGGNSTTPDPPSVTPSWGSTKTLWIAAASENSTSVATAAPTNYGNLITVAAANNSAMSATRELEASSENPGGFTIPSSVEWHAQLIAIRGA